MPQTAIKLGCGTGTDQGDHKPEFSSTQWSSLFGCSFGITPADPGRALGQTLGWGVSGRHRHLKVTHSSGLGVMWQHIDQVHQSRALEWNPGPPCAARGTVKIHGPDLMSRKHQAIDLNQRTRRWSRPCSTCFARGVRTSNCRLPRFEPLAAWPGWQILCRSLSLGSILGSCKVDTEMCGFCHCEVP